MVNFDEGKINYLKTYDGEAKKIALIYQKNQYMLKFPLSTKLNRDISKHKCVAEYVGSYIYKTIGIDVQDVLLGYYSHSTIVACKDFAVAGYTLNTFKSIANQVIENREPFDIAEIKNIINITQHQHVIDPAIMQKRFWDMFIVDALIGNSSRTCDDFGYLYNEQFHDVQLAPVYDCDSSFYPYFSEQQMEAILCSPKTLESMVLKSPPSAMKNNGQRINYCRFINSLENCDCNDALVRIACKVDIPRIHKIIDNVPCASNIHKNFLKAVIGMRKEKIIDSAILKLKSNKKE